jgi:nucleotide-binding universal stress UspA family protein
MTALPDARKATMNELSAPTTKRVVTGPICIGVDGTAASWDALAWAEQELASTTTADGPRRMIICRSYPANTAGARLPNPPHAAWLALDDPGLDRKLRDVRQRLLTDDIALRVHAGSLADHVISMATADGISVIAAPPRDPGTAVQVAAHAPGITVAVRTTTPPAAVTAGPFADHVVVGVNGSSSRAAVRYAFDYAGRHGKPIAAIHARAHDPGGAWVDGDDGAGVHLMPYAFGLDRLEAEVAEAHETWPGVRVRRFVLREDAASALVRASSGAVLLVVGDRGRPAIARRMLGSVSRHAVRAAHCSVAVVHDRGGTP